MSKIICDVCGTSYPESAMQCPICGCVRSADSRLVAGDTGAPESEANGSYTYVKGGRFSKANVRKRNAPIGANAPVATATVSDTDIEKPRSDKGLIIAVVLLLLAIIAVVIYISLRFFGTPAGDNKQDDKNQSISDTQTDVDQEDDQADDQTPAEIPCVSLVVSDVVVTFDEAGKTLQLSVTPDPVDTTDDVVYTSDDVNIATVDATGLVTAVGAGDTIIRVKCGEAEVQCSVSCTFESSTTDPDGDDQPVDPSLTVTLNRTDFTMSYRGETWNLYSGTAPLEDVTWTTSDTDVATVSGGVVTMVGNSFTGDYATITAVYNGTKVTCIVRWGGASGVPGSGNVTEAN